MPQLNAYIYEYHANDGRRPLHNPSPKNANIIEQHVFVNEHQSLQLLHLHTQSLHLPKLSLLRRAPGTAFDGADRKSTRLNSSHWE